MKTFYDIHMHAFDLSHPNLLAFIKREGLLDADNLTSKLLESVSKKKRLLGGIMKFKKKAIRKSIDAFIQEKLPKLENYLAIMENPIEYQFLMLDHFLKTKEQVVDKSNRFALAGSTYEKIVLCPLLMDFGNKNIDIHKKVFYDQTPKKPIKKQVEDVLNAIQVYYTHSMRITNEGKMTLVEDALKDQKLFEIYPFMGLNTQHYSMSGLQGLIKKYFAGYEGDSPQERKAKLIEKLGKFNGDIDAEDMTYFFAGIKMYPPLGFNPWPEGAELAKVKWLYQAAIDKNIPIITHCSDGGFKVVNDEKFEYNTNPEKAWSKVLAQKEFKDLKICFAHFGSQKPEKNGNRPDEWRRTIIDLMNRHQHVYADFSCCEGASYYKDLNKILKENKVLEERLLFGSDFSINLLANKDEQSYNGYLNRFIDPSNGLDAAYKNEVCCSNSEKFLFGGLLSSN